MVRTTNQRGVSPPQNASIATGGAPDGIQVLPCPLCLCREGKLCTSPYAHHWLENLHDTISR
ncbi:MAG: hypothetical protein ACOYNM_18230 [Gemmataceae bacterium]